MEAGKLFADWQDRFNLPTEILKLSHIPPEVPYGEITLNKMQPLLHLCCQLVGGK